MIETKIVIATGYFRAIGCIVKPCADSVKVIVKYHLINKVYNYIADNDLYSEVEESSGNLTEIWIYGDKVRKYVKELEALV